MHIYIYVYLSIYLSLSLYIHIYIYIYTDTYTHNIHITYTIYVYTSLSSSPLVVIYDNAIHAVNHSKCTVNNAMPTIAAVVTTSVFDPHKTLCVYTQVLLLSLSLMHNSNTTTITNSTVYNPTSTIIVVVTISVFAPSSERLIILMLLT